MKTVEEIMEMVGNLKEEYERHYSRYRPSLTPPLPGETVKMHIRRIFKNASLKNCPESPENELRIVQITMQIQALCYVLGFASPYLINNEPTEFAELRAQATSALSDNGYDFYESTLIIDDFFCCIKTLEYRLGIGPNECTIFYEDIDPTSEDSEGFQNMHDLFGDASYDIVKLMFDDSIEYLGPLEVDYDNDEVIEIIAAKKITTKNKESIWYVLVDFKINRELGTAWIMHESNRNPTGKTITLRWNEEKKDYEVCWR